jgi:FkbM family methyltransferase
MIGGPRPASFTLDGCTFNCSTAEKYFFEREHYEQELWSALSRLVGPSDVVYDFGAEIVFLVLRLSRVCKHVVGFEPSPTNFKRLQLNVSDIKNVTLVNAALAAEEGELRLTEAGTMSVLGRGDVMVKTTTLDASAARYPTPTLLLMDVEGYAGEVLRGAEGLLAQKVPLICEIHHEQENETAFKTLKESGYEISRLDYTHRYPYRILAK